MNRNRLLLLCLGVFWASLATAQFTRELSPNAIVSLMTVAPGNEVYSIYGHSALRIYDPSQNVDRIYNYGTFDFDQPNFLLKFCQGKLLYILDIERYKSFEKGNLLDGRPMQEQVLNLSPIQKSRLFNMLEENALPANRGYKYDFFYDNCATRIRDILRTGMYDQVQFDTAAPPSKLTMRQLLKPYHAKHPWTDFGIDLVLGMPTDRSSRPDKFMFLPDHLHDAFSLAKLSEGQPLVGQTFTVGTAMPSTKDDQIPISPMAATTSFAVLGVLSLFNKRASRIFDIFFWFLIGLAGVIIAALWFLTDHTATKNNLNMFWALPTHILFFWRKRNLGLLDSYYIITGILAVGILVGWQWLPQALPVAAIPIIVLVAIKGFARRTSG